MTEKAYSINELHNLYTLVNIAWNDNIKAYTVFKSIEINELNLSPKETERYAMLKLLPFGTDIRGIGFRAVNSIVVVADEQ